MLPLNIFNQIDTKNYDPVHVNSTSAHEIQTSHVEFLHEFNYKHLGPLLNSAPIHNFLIWCH
jgi:hypothetical protein